MQQAVLMHAGSLLTLRSAGLLAVTMNRNVAAAMLYSHALQTHINNFVLPTSGALSTRV